MACQLLRGPSAGLLLCLLQRVGVCGVAGKASELTQLIVLSSVAAIELSMCSHLCYICACWAMLPGLLYRKVPLVQDSQRPAQPH